jgi:hypothetical protein
VDFLKIYHLPSFRGTRLEHLFESPSLAPLHFRSLDNPEFAHNIAWVYAGVLIRSLPSSAVKRPPLAARTTPRGAQFIESSTVIVLIPKNWYTFGEGIDGIKPQLCVIPVVRREPAANRLLVLVAVGQPRLEKMYG